MELSEDIGSMNFRAFLQNNKGIADSNAFFKSDIYSYPSNDQLMHIFLSYFSNMEHTYQEQMEALPCKRLTCDHTFKVSKHIGVVRSLDNAFINQFENLFIDLNENGQAVAWRLTRTTAFKEFGRPTKGFEKLCGRENRQGRLDNGGLLLLHSAIIWQGFSWRPS